jgi:cytochrome c551/c552
VRGSRGGRTRLTLVAVPCFLLAALGVETGGQRPEPAPAPAPVAAHGETVTRYCVTCHNDRLKTAGLSLQSVSVADVAANAEIFEKVVRKVRAGMMPPQGVPRPAAGELDRLAAFLETSLDAAALARPAPGPSITRRLNRAEYGNAVRDLFGIDQIDIAALLPADDEAHGFDNVVDALTVSPALTERYLAAAWKISAVAVGDPAIQPKIDTFRVRSDLSQRDHIDGLPLGTRGGVLVDYYAPVDGEYVIRPKLWKNTVEQIGGLEVLEQLEITVDGARVLLAAFGGPEDEAKAFDVPRTAADEIERRFVARLPLTAGPHAVGVTFIKKSSAPPVGLLRPFERDRIDPVSQIGPAQIERVSIEGPLQAAGAARSPSRRRIFLCAPTAAAAEPACARRILTDVSRRAYRRPPTATEVDRLMRYFREGREATQTFDGGIQQALTFLLVSPPFLYRVERAPAATGAAAAAPVRVSDIDLASRLSFFLWSSIPDDQLLNLAARGQLRQPRMLAQQVRRMLADPRARALGSNFASQWLYLRNLASAAPDHQEFPDFDDNLRRGLRRETEMLFENVVLADRPVPELLTADYTFVNERVARHYGIAGVYGTRFRRVRVTDERRRGLLGHASILTLTSYPNRTSPVNRGKYVLTNLLGTPPPPPPPDVPPLNETPGRVLAMRERMAQHRANAVCATCHKLMDPIGLSLENFDATGRWRTDDKGATIDPTDVLYNGVRVDGPVALRAAVLANQQQFVHTMAEKLLTYALGRGLTAADMPVVRAIVRQAQTEEYRFSSLVLATVSSAPFQQVLNQGIATH